HPAVGTLSGLRPAVQCRARRAVAADAADAGILRRAPAVDPRRLPHPAAARRGDDGRLSRAGRKRVRPARETVVSNHGRTTRRHQTHISTPPTTPRPAPRPPTPTHPPHTYHLPL